MWLCILALSYSCSAVRHSPFSPALTSVHQFSEAMNNSQVLLTGALSIIRGVLWFDNMYPMRAHWLDPRFLLVSHNHHRVVPKVIAVSTRHARLTLFSSQYATSSSGPFQLVFRTASFLNRITTITSKGIRFSHHFLSRPI